MKVYSGNNMDDMWLAAARSLTGGAGKDTQSSRGGDTYEELHVYWELKDPKNRWVFSRQPALNPAFALAEVVWILAGRDDSIFLSFWNSQIKKFAGGGSNFYGAYGQRLRYNLEYDQLLRAYQALASVPESRQVVLQIWDGAKDMPASSGRPRAKDIPCNICSLLKIRNNQLEWSQIIRSNDIFLGVPHNIVQFTSLQEIMAGWLGVEPGPFYMYSDSLHLYERDLNHFANIQKLKRAKNTDDLALCYKDCMIWIRYLERMIVEMVHRRTTQKQLLGAKSSKKIPNAYRNMLLILEAEYARRMKWFATKDQLISEVDNPALQLLWKNWINRISPIK